MLKCILQGVVVSDKQVKIIVVCVDCCFMYLIYKKMICCFKNYYVYDESNQFKLGDMVWIEEIKLILKLKCWVVIWGEYKKSV